MAPRDSSDPSESRIRRFIRAVGSFDFAQLTALLFLLAVGVLFIWSTGRQAGGFATGFYLKQLQWIALGGVLWLFFSLVDYRNWLVLSGVFYLTAVGLLLSLRVIGVQVNNARSWIDVPLLGMRLQPSEFTKLAVVMVLAAIFASRKFSINSFRCLLLCAAVILIPFYLVVREPDLGSALVLIPTGGAMIFAAGMRWKYLLWGFGIVLVLATAVTVNEVVAFRPLLKEYQKARLRSFLDPESDPQHRGYNQLQALLAVGSGGLSGKGIGQGTQNGLGFLPQSVANNDFIFSVIAEETGFLGCLLLFLAYLLLLYSLLRTAFLTPDPYGRYLTVGLAALLFTHCFINLGMSIGVTPVTGIPLPFVSYGGSFMLMGLIGLGLSQSVWRHRQPDE